MSMQAILLGNGLLAAPAVALGTAPPEPTSTLFVCALYWMCDEPQQKTAARLPKTRSALAPAVSVLLVV
jgi:hypothetical protein